MSRTIAFVSIAALFLLSLAPLGAQEEEGAIAVVNRVTPKAGMASSYEEGLETHNEFHAKHGDSRSWLTWQVIGGERAGDYLRAGFDFEWSDFDVEPTPSLADDTADEEVNTRPHLESSTTQYYRLMTAHSRPPDEEGPSPMAVLYHDRVIAEKEADYLNAISKLPEALEKADSPVHYFLYRLELGGDHPTYVWSLPREEWADFADPEKTFRTVLEEAYGETEADNILHTFTSSSHGVTSEVAIYRADLSYIPAATSND